MLVVGGLIVEGNDEGRSAYGICDGRAPDAEDLVDERWRQSCHGVTFGNDPTVGHRYELVSMASGLMQIVKDHHDRDASFEVEPAEESENLDPMGQVQKGGGLVEQ